VLSIEFGFCGVGQFVCCDFCFARVYVTAGEHLGEMAPMQQTRSYLGV